jgi:hypothetical protein
VRKDDFIRINHRETAGLDALFLRKREQAVEKLLIDLQHFDKFHKTAIGNVKFAVKAVGAGV